MSIFTPAFERLQHASQCPVCKTNNVDHTSKYPSEVEPFASSEVKYCSRCGVGFVVDASELLRGYYEQSYSQTNRKDREIDPEQYFSDSFYESSPGLKRYFNRGTRQINLLEALGNPVRSLLDFGSGPGYLLFLSNAKRKLAFEPDTDSHKYLDYINAERFQDLDKLPIRELDAIVSSHSLEHLDILDATDTIKRLLLALKKNGHLLIEVPQGGHTHMKLKDRQDPHTIFFTNESFKRTIEEAGGEIVYETCFSRKEAPKRKDAIYKPKGPSFIRFRGGAVTIVCQPSRSLSIKRIRRKLRPLKRLFSR